MSSYIFLFFIFLFFFIVFTYCVKIEDTFEIPFFGGMKYDVDQNNGYGEGIVIDGTKYYLMTYGDYKEGDVVTIKVLPKSKLILEMESVR